MTSVGTVKFKVILELLDTCASGYKLTPKKHNYWVYYGEREFKALPRGEHGHRRNSEIQIGKIKQMVNKLGIDKRCAQRIIPALNLNTNET